MCPRKGIQKVIEGKIALEIREGAAALRQANGEPTAIALGFFDGVHLGHRAVLSAAANYAAQASLAAAVFTFTLPQPSAAAPPRLPMKGLRLCTPLQKHEQLAAQGMQFCFEPAFEDFANLAPQAFFSEWLRGRFNARALFCGENFTFGARRAGTPALLEKLCAEADVFFAQVPTALYKGQAVSSSRIRAALAAGNMEEAGLMLGRPYEIFLPVLRGRRFGSAHGFPTINQVFPAWLQPPKPGVYVSETIIQGRAWPSATGYGTRPTVAGKEATCETFIPGFAGNLYDETIRVRLHSYLGEPRKFASGQELSAAVHAWAAQAENWLALHNQGR